jgi:hypothetical protein
MDNWVMIILFGPPILLVWVVSVASIIQLAINIWETFRD